MLTDVAGPGSPWDIGPPEEWYWEVRHPDGDLDKFPASRARAQVRASAGVLTVAESPALGAIAGLLDAAGPGAGRRCRACRYLKARCKCPGVSARAAVA